MAQAIVGLPIYSYDLQVETKIAIDELIYILTPEDLPLLSGIGADGMPVLAKQAVDNTEFYWMEESVPLPRGTLGAPIADATTGTGITFAAGDGVKFRVGDAIRIDAEVMKIVAFTAADVATVIRGSAAVTNTNGATHAAGAEVVGLGSVVEEGAIVKANFTGRDRYSNYTQIWTASLEMSRTEQSIQKYGVPNELNKQTVNNTQITNTDMEQAALYGVKHKEVNAGGQERQTGGLDFFITSNVNSTDPHITVKSVEVMQQAIFDKGGSIEFIMARPANFVALNNTSGAERVQTVTIDDTKRGRRRATVVMTEFGEVGLVRNRWVRKKDAFTFSRDNFVQRVFQPLILEKLAKTRDTDAFFMVAEGGFEVKGEAHCGKWTALDATAALPAGLV